MMRDPYTGEQLRAIRQLPRNTVGMPRKETIHPLVWLALAFIIGLILGFR